MNHVQIRGHHKVADKREDATYRVVEQPNEYIPVYEVHLLDGTGRVRHLHRNLLWPIAMGDGIGAVDSHDGGSGGSSSTHS